jgi:GxxExxY protein
MKYTVKKDIVIYPELSFQVVGCAFEVMKGIGADQKESAYQRSMALMFESKKKAFKEQVYYPLTFQGKTVGKNFFDFLVEDKIIVELKKNFTFSKAHIDHVNNYLKISGLNLVILINFGKQGAMFKRIVNTIKT